MRLPRKIMHIEVICTGDEVLTGKIVNTNFSYISQKLEDFGLSVQWETTVGDDRDMHRFALFDGSVGSGARPPRPRLSRYTL